MAEFTLDPPPTTVEGLLSPNKYLVAAQTSNAVPQDQNALSLQPDTIAQSYAKAGISRNSVIKANAATLNARDANIKKEEMVLKKAGDVAALAKAIEEGQAAAANTIGDFKKKRTSPELGYVTAAQAKLYVGGILLDECYDLQYQYKEFKEPVYGYLSKHFDAVLKGNVIISGTFTINYKHDAYLIKLLERIQQDKTVQGDSVKKAWARKQRLEDDTRAYLKMLEQYKSEFDGVKAAEAIIKFNNNEITMAQQELAVANKYPTIVEKDFAAKAEAAEKKKVDFMAGLTPEDKAKVLSDETKFVDANTNYQEGVGKNNAKLQSVQDRIDATNASLKEEKVKISDVELKLSSLPRGSTEPYVKELEAELQRLLANVAMLNKLLTIDRETFDTVQKDNVTYSTEQTEKVQDTLDDNSKAYIAVKLQAEKLKSEKKVAARNAASKIKDIEARIANLKAANEVIEADVKEKTTALEEIKKKLSTSKDDINSLNKAVMDAANKANEADALKSTHRPEDYGTWTPGKFSMFIEYNGVIHKILEDCTLTGHGHVVAQGGEVIKEYYTFISKKIR